MLCLNGMHLPLYPRSKPQSLCQCQDTKTHEPFIFPPSCSILYLLWLPPIPPFGIPGSFTKISEIQFTEFVASGTAVAFMSSCTAGAVLHYLRCASGVQPVPIFEVGGSLLRRYIFMCCCLLGIAVGDGLSLHIQAC